MMNIHPAPIAAEYAMEYARGHQQAAMWIWWAMLCGQAPDMLQYSYRTGVSAVWVQDTDMPGREHGHLAAAPEANDWSWLTRENAQRQIQRDADRSREAAEFEARRQNEVLQWDGDRP